MSWLTAEDLKTIGATLGPAAALALWAAWRAWRDYKAGAPFLASLRSAQAIQTALFIGFMMLLLPAEELARRRGWGGWSWLAVAAPCIVLASAISLVQSSRARRRAMANPAAGPTPKAPPSAEEARVNRRLNVALIVFAALTIGPIMLITFNIRTIGPAGAVIGFFIALAALAILTWGLAGRWPGSVATQASVEIAAPPETVWRAIRPDATLPHWKKIVRRVEPLDGAGKRFRLHYFNNDVCATCGLPRDPQSPGFTCEVEVLDETRPRRLSLRGTPAGAGGAKLGMMACETTDFELAPLAEGRTRVDVANAAVRPKAWLALMLRLGDPGGEELRALKAHIEGAAIDTIYATGAQRLDEARHAPAFCGCPAGTPAAGLLRVA